MAKSNNKLISNDYEDNSHLIENEEKDENESKLSSLLSRTCSKNSFCIQLSIVCVLFSLLILLTIVKLTTNSSQSFNTLIDRLSANDNKDNSNETDFSDNIFKNTKLRHGSIRVITHCGTLFGGKEQEAYVFKVSIKQYFVSNFCGKTFFFITKVLLKFDLQ
jgi:hypothetical protein